MKHGEVAWLGVKEVKVTVQNGNVDLAIRQLRKLIDKLEILDEYKRRQTYLKPSLAKRQSGR